MLAKPILVMIHTTSATPACRMKEPFSTPVLSRISKGIKTESVLYIGKQTACLQVAIPCILASPDAGNPAVRRARVATRQV